MNSNPLNPSVPFAVVVNDNPTQLTVLSGLVRKAGLEPRAFISAEAALVDMAAYAGAFGSTPKGLPALVVTDLYMPGIDGWRFCLLLRSPEYATLNQVPIVVVSATYTGEEPERIAAILGAEAFLSSPVDGRHFVHQVREILQGSEEKFRKFFACNTSTMLIIDPDRGDIVQANKAAADYYGWSIDDLQHMRIQDLNTLAPEVVQREMMKTRSLGALRHEFCHRRMDGSHRHVEVFSSRIEIAGKDRLCSIIHDITERKQAEEQLRNQRWRLEMILEGTRAGTWEWNIQTGAAIFNERWAEIIGYSLVELAPSSIKIWEMLVHPDDLKRSVELLEQHFAGKQPYYHCECRMKHKDGRWIWILDRGRIVTRTDDGLPLLMFGTHTDISGRKQAEEIKARLEALNQQLQKNDSLQRMAGAIAHTFNNQLGVVMGNLEMALEDRPQDATLVKSLTAAMQGARKAAEVSGLMLTYLGQTTGEHVPLDLSEVCRQGLTLLQAAAPKCLCFKADLPSPGPVVRANANEIRQILTNLVTNGWEAIGDKQRVVHLSIRTVTQKDIAAAQRFPVDWQPRDLSYACLEVSDSGCGIAIEDINKLFDPFFSTKFVGRGLGLPVVLGIIKAHNGVVTVQSEAGTGTALRIYLPVSAEEIPRQTMTTGKIPTHQEGYTVLVVDDEEMLREIAEAMLTRLGYKVLPAKDGIEAVEVFKKLPGEIHAVLCDLSMPRMNGWETLSALRLIQPDIPIILASGHDESAVLAGDHPERPQVFLHKPYVLLELNNAIRRALGPPPGDPL